MSKSIEKVINLIQSYMEEDGLIWHKPFLSAGQANAASKNEYRGINHFITSIVAHKRGYTSPYWATYKQINDLNGKLTNAKGKGVPIIFYKDLINKDDDKKRFVLRYSFVSNLDLVEGIDVKVEHPERVAFDRDTASESVIKQYVDRESVIISTGNPSYTPTTDVVRMLAKEQFISQDEYYSAYFHELAHSTGHNKRLARFDTEQVKYESKEDYSKEELVAEITAALICHQCGVEAKQALKIAQPTSKDGQPTLKKAVPHLYQLLARHTKHVI